MSEHATQLTEGDGSSRKVSLKLSVDESTRNEAERLALGRGLRFGGRGNVSAIFAVLVHEEARRQPAAA